MKDSFTEFFKVLIITIRKKHHLYVLTAEILLCLKSIPIHFIYLVCSVWQYIMCYTHNRKDSRTKYIFNCMKISFSDFFWGTIRLLWCLLLLLIGILRVMWHHKKEIYIVLDMLCTLYGFFHDLCPLIFPHLVQICSWAKKWL